MEEKNVTKINLSTFLLIIAIIAIIVMGIFIYKLNNDKTAEIQKSTELQSQVNSLNETVSDLQGKINDISNTDNSKSESNIIEEKTIDINNSIVKEQYAKIKGAGETLYEYVNTKKDDLPNKVKLVLGYHNLKEGSLQEYDSNEFSRTGNSYYLPEETLSKSIESILGNNILYSHENFDAYRIRLTETLKYNKEQKRYNTNFEFGGDSNYFDEKIISASIQGEQLNIYVKPVFFKLEAEKYGVSDANYDAYANYDYNTGTFSNMIQKKVLLIDDIEISKFDTYKYVFLKQGDNYYFDSLQKVN